MKNYDGIMKKIFEGIREIPDRSLREFVLINLLGTRGDQNLEMVADRTLAQELSPPRAYYDREVGNIAGSIVKEGKKQLPENVPLGPFLRDMMDARWDRITNFGEIAEDVGMWDDLPENINLGALVDTYVFKITKDNPRGIFTAKEIGLLNRPDKPIPSGFTDLRRLTMAWNARKTGKRALADELLGHGKSEISEGSEMISAVGSQYYLPGTPTPIDNLRAFNTALEQNIAKLLGYENYTELNNKWNILGADENGVVGNYINAVPKFKTETIIPPTVQGQIDVEEIIPTQITYQPDSSEIIEAREQERLAQAKEGVATANLNIYNKAFVLAKKLSIPFEEAYQMTIDRSKVLPPPIKLTGKAKEISDNAKHILNKDGSVNKSLLHNQSPATEADIKNAEQQTGANRNTRAGRNTIRKVLAGVGKYMPVISAVVGGVSAYSVLQQPSEAWAESTVIQEGPLKGKKDAVGQMLELFGVDTEKELQAARATYEAGSGILPKWMTFAPGGRYVIPTKQEAEENIQHNIDVANKLAEEEVY